MALAFREPDVTRRCLPFYTIWINFPPQCIQGYKTSLLHKENIFLLVWCWIMCFNIFQNDVQWFIVMWHYMMWCQIIWCDMSLFKRHVVQPDVIWCDTKWSDFMLYDRIWCKSIWFAVKWIDVIYDVDQGMIYDIILYDSWYGLL